MSERKYTRIDLEQADEEFDGEGVFRRMWLEGWEENQAPDKNDFLPGRRLYDLTREAEKKGWSVTQFNDTEVQLLRGEVIRVDFYQVGNTVRIDQYPEGWKAHTRPMKQETHPGVIEDFLKPYEELGWTIRQWADGARAFAPGKQFPVHDTYTIIRLRRQYGERPSELQRLTGGTRRIDFAFDL